MWTKALFPLLTFAMSSPSIAQKCDSNYEQKMQSQVLATSEDILDSSVEALPNQCIDGSMEAMERLVKAYKGKFKPFAYCDDQGNYESSTVPLCRTAKIVSDVRSIFHIVTDCLEIPPKALFPLINVESGFFPNALAPGGEDAGLGQMTPIAAADVNIRWDWLSDYIRSSDKPSCRLIQPHLSSLRVENIESKYVCQFIDAEFNPLRNTLYAGYFFLINTKYLERFFKEQQIEQRLSLLLSRSISKKESAQIAHFINISSYNKGFLEMSNHLIDFVQKEEMKRGFSWGDVTQISEEIHRLKKEIEVQKAALNIKNIQSLRLEIQTKQQEYDALISKHQTPLDFDVFNIKNTSKDSLRTFLRERNAHRYLDLILSKTEEVEKAFGEGHCSEFNLPTKSSALEYIIW